jgi:hypothetical protein
LFSFVFHYGTETTIQTIENLNLNQQEFRAGGMGIECSQRGARAFSAPYGRMPPPLTLTLSSAASMKLIPFVNR